MSATPTIPSDDLIVGIDLGTTNSLVAVCDRSGPRVLRVGKGGTDRVLLPSVVRYEQPPVRSDRRVHAVVGDDARARAPEFPRTTISSIKRFMGRGMRDAAADAGYVSYEVVAGERDTVRVRVPFDPPLLLSPEEVSADVLRTLRHAAERELGMPVRKAVVTVPAYFDDAQRQATRMAGRLAGLDVVRIVPEPTAAALAYGIGLSRANSRNTRTASTVCVYDFGGGTFDVSVLRITPATRAGDTDFYQVLATSGDTHLGGDDIDHALVEMLTREWNIREPSPATKRELLALAERVKVELSENESAAATLEIDGHRHQRVISRREFEALVAPIIERTIRCCERAIREAARLNLIDEHAPARGLDSVILVGGSTRIPLVRRRVAECFSLEPYTALDPDQVVALGAAVQGAILSGVVEGSLLLDVVPLSLGVETVGGAVAKIIPRSSTVPVTAREMFSTSADNQTSIRLTVYQGEREMAADCRRLAEFHLRGIPPMPAGVPQVEVTFQLDANGVLSVRAIERRSGKRAELQVVPNHGLTQEEADRMERESLLHAREDMARHRIVDLIANSELDIRAVEAALARVRGELDQQYASLLQDRIAQLGSTIALARTDWRAVDADAFHRAKEDLDRASMRLHEVAIARSLRESPPPQPTPRP